MRRSIWRGLMKSNVVLAIAILTLAAACGGALDGNGPAGVGADSTPHTIAIHPTGAAHMGANGSSAYLGPLVKHSGTTLYHPSLYMVTYGGIDAGNAYQQFLRDIVNTNYFTALGEYQVYNASFKGFYYDLAHKPPSRVTDNQIQSWLTDLIAHGTIPAAGGSDMIYVVFTPPGVTVDSGGGLSCRDFCGYHTSGRGNRITVSSFIYAVIPDMTARGCSCGSDNYDAVTSVVSHELAEAATDPFIGFGNIAWRSDRGLSSQNGGEIGDLCAWWQYRLTAPGGRTYTVQQEYDNRSMGCIDL
jgi:hypothetical protein